MSADNIPCKFFPDKTCPIDCLNHAKERHTIQRVSEIFGLTEEEGISKIKEDPDANRYAQVVKERWPKELERCLQNKG